LSELDTAISNYEHLLHLKLKTALLIQEIKQSIHGDVNGDYYEEYPYNDYEIEDKFDDTFAMGMLKLNILRDDFMTVRGIVDFIYNDKYVPSDNIRIIYVYNR
jgi:hypothetical protein